MRDPTDVWYVRLPDGRVMRAKSSSSVRHHIESGRIPVDCWVRRSGEDDWTTLEWTVEFSDLASQKRKRAESPEGGARKPDPASTGRENNMARGHAHELRTVGVRGMVEELLTALDSTVNRTKLEVAVLACLVGSGVVATLRLMEPADWEAPWPLACWIGAGLILVALAALCTALLTQMTVVELSRLRPARWPEAVHGLGKFSLRLLVSQVLIGGAVVLATTGLRALPGWIVSQDFEGPLGPDYLAAGATVLGLILQVLLWPILGLALLLGPILIIEECTILKGILQWWRLVRQHLSQVLFYEALAGSLGAIMTLPFLFPVLVAGWFSLDGNSLADLTWSTLYVLGGAALTPLIAYLVVANVFIYLNLRYEFSGPR